MQIGGIYIDIDDWIYTDYKVLPDDKIRYHGKFIHEIDSNNFSILLSKNHLEQLQLILAFCCDREKLDITKQAKYFYEKLKDDIEDVVFGG